MITPTEIVLVLIAGAMLAGLLVLAARRLARGELHVYAVVLLAAALVYAVNATLAGAGQPLLEWLGVPLFGVFAAAGVRRPGAQAAGWALHVAWDLAIPAHHAGQLVPAWYPVLCVGFDLALAAYLWRKKGRLLRVHFGRKGARPLQHPS